MSQDELLGAKLEASKLHRRESLVRIFSLLILMISVVVTPVCVKPTREQRDAALKDLEKLCPSVPIPDSFVPIDSRTSADDLHVALFRKFRSVSQCAETGEYFTSYFSSIGWDKTRMKSSKEGGGMKTLQFRYRDGDYRVAVDCELYPGPGEKRDMSLSCSWNFGADE